MKEASLIRLVSRSPLGPLRLAFSLFTVFTLLALLAVLTACGSSGASGGATAPTATANATSAGGAGAGTGSGSDAGTGGPRLSFKEAEHDFGQISHSTPMEYRFAFTNTGGAPLQVSDIKAEPIDPASCA